jgi:SAM-dependent methyltransferase
LNLAGGRDGQKEIEVFGGLVKMKQSGRRGSHVQQQIWHANALDWSQIQEWMFVPVYQSVIEDTQITKGKIVLDVGCSTGLFCKMAYLNGANVAGIDPSVEMINLAEGRGFPGEFKVGDIANLDWPSNTFDVVCALDSLPYSSNPFGSLLEAKRTTKLGGLVVVGAWSRPCDCESADYLYELCSLMPKTEADSIDPFAGLCSCDLEEFASSAGLTPVVSRTVRCDWHYPDLAVAMRGLLSTTQAVKAAHCSSYDAVFQATRRFLYAHNSGNEGYVLRNKFTYHIAIV